MPELRPPLSVIQMVEVIIAEAQRLKASDIHLDPRETCLAIRFRMDGVMQEMHRLPKRLHAEIIARIKVLASLRTDEHDISQDGRFRLIIGGQTVDIRLSIIPTYYGENAVMRLLGSSAIALDLAALGLSPPQEQLIRAGISRSHGLILVTGPTGSGKTTTLYSCLKLLDASRLTIITLEDPIEYTLDAINQVPVNGQTGLSFNRGLRAILRQDPDVIMVGEVRDQDTAQLAINAALTGHLILSTLHTSNAVTTLPRLLDMAVEPYLVVATLDLIISQRLVRKICPECRQKESVTADEWQSMCRALSFAEDLAMPELFFGRGCAKCKNTGFRGRIGLFELLKVSDEMRQAIIKRAPSHVLQSLAQRQGMVTLLADGWKKVQQGLTTINELMRIIHE